QLFGQVYNNTEVQQINPSISAGMVKPIGKDLNLGIWLGHVNRSGSLTERFINYFPVGLDPYELIGNPQIKAEKNNQIDLTLAWKKEKSSLNIDVFASWLTDYITSEIDTTLKPRLPASPGVRRFTNIDNAFKTGFEFRW
ncbi:TonB-dependent receptor, partial [Arthrospira platensis SPKY1]|nr:TonB-dependent receptor [Arthrospira platensis SPKY1]